MVLSTFVSGLMVLVLAAAVASPWGRRCVVRRFKTGIILRRTMVGSYLVIGVATIIAAVMQARPAAEVATWPLLRSLPYPDSGRVLVLPILALIATIGVLLRARISPEISAQPRRFLAIGAHPDDLELACGATLARLVDSGHEVHGIVMSRGAVGGDASTRPKEAQRGADFLGLRSIEVHDFPDTNLALVANDLIRAIEEKIKEVQPHIILTHSANDQHQDHNAVHIATLRAARQHHSILCFESPSSTRDFKPDVFIDVNDYTAVKVAAVLTHRNQAGKPYMTPDVVRSVTGFRGRQAKTGHAEGFEVVRLLVNEAGVL